MIGNIFLFVTLALRGTAALNSSDLAKIDATFSSFIKGENLPTTVRLVFHDCVGGCDGCVNINDPSNAGLQNIIGLLDKAYTDRRTGYSKLMSRADFWVYASLYALKNTTAQANAACSDAACAVPKSSLVFTTGRKDCATAPFTDSIDGLPGANLNYEGVVDYFRDEFGFTDEESIALMGVHTLGSAHSNASGYQGPWVRGETTLFNNRYYSTMSSPGWSQRNVDLTGSSPKVQWNSRTGMMLNADMGLFKDFTLNQNGEASCAYDKCGATPGAAKVLEYSKSNAVWVRDFESVFTKMINHGAENLQKVAV